ncbi:methyltransferase [Aureococcus anophagefferens]|nr:methyltransferase [Aureococcus anophagefferens]
MPSLSSQTKASLSKASLFRRTSSGLSPAIESSDSVDGKYVSSGKEKLDAICSDGRLVNEKAAEQAAREAAWIAATVANLERLKSEKDCAAQAAENVKGYVPPVGGLGAALARAEAARRIQAVDVVGLGEQSAAEQALASMEQERLATAAPAKAAADVDAETRVAGENERFARVMRGGMQDYEALDEVHTFKEELFANVRPATRSSRSASAGPNLQYYGPHAKRVVAVEPNLAFDTFASDEAQATGTNLEVREGVAERLRPDGSADAVVGTMVLCSVTSVAASLAEVRRVLKPGGRYLFSEHTRAPDGWNLLATAQTVASPLQLALANGCHLRRDPCRTSRRASARPTCARSFVLGNTGRGPWPPLSSRRAVGVATRLSDADRRVPVQAAAAAPAAAATKQGLDDDDDQSEADAEQRARVAPASRSRPPPGSVAARTAAAARTAPRRDEA